MAVVDDSPPSSLSEIAAERPSFRWVVLAAGSVAQGSFSAFALGLPALSPALREHYSLSLTQTGVLLASVNIGILATMLAWGLAADKRGERAVVVIGLLGAAAALAVAAFTPAYTVLLVLLVLGGGFGASVNSGTGRAVMSWFAADERGLALGIRQTSIPLAGAAAAVTLPWIAASHGLGLALVALAIGCVVGAAAGAAALGSNRATPGRAMQSPAPVASAPIGEALRDRRLLTLSLASFLVCIGQVAIVGFLVLFLHDDRDLSPANAALVLAASQIIGATIRISAGAWSDRVGTRIGPFRVLALSLAIMLAAVALLTAAPLVVLIPLIAIVAGISMGWNSLSFAIAAELGDVTRTGAAIGVQQTTLAFAAVGVPVLFAVTVAATSWQVAFAGAAIFPFLGWLVLGVMARSTRAGAPR